MIAKDLTGKRFGRLQVLGKGSGKSSVSWLCVCDCGNTKSIITGSLEHGKSKSCGCLLAETTRNTHAKHGMYKTKVYRVWAGMIQRCYNPNKLKYKDYGGRGITVCSEWRKFENFFKDMGERPIDKTIDRINNDGNYEPSNCKWSTAKEQSRNTRNSKYLTYKGETKLLLEWAEQLGIKRHCLQTRIHRGWSTERALNTPAKSA